MIPLPAFQIAMGAQAPIFNRVACWWGSSRMGGKDGNEHNSEEQLHFAWAMVCSKSVWRGSWLTNKEYLLGFPNGNDGKDDGEMTLQYIAWKMIISNGQYCGGFKLYTQIVEGDEVWGNWWLRWTFMYEMDSPTSLTMASSKVDASKQARQRSREAYMIQYIPL